MIKVYSLLIKIPFKGLKVTDQTAIDHFMLELDGTKNKCKLSFFFYFNKTCLLILNSIQTFFQVPELYPGELH